MNALLSSAMYSTIVPSHDEIARCARGLWSEAGQPHGHDDEFWFEAKHRLLEARQAPNVSAVIFACLAQPVTRANTVKDTTPAMIRGKR
jgi:hypothetical protein